MDCSSELKPKNKKPRISWSQEDDDVFLSCWEGSAWELRKCQRNSHIFARMAKEVGPKFSGEDLKTKVKNYTQKYRKEKSKMGPSGGSPSEWRHFNRVHKIIGSNAANDTAVDESFLYEFLDSDENIEPNIEMAVHSPIKVALPLSSTTSTSSTEVSCDFSGPSTSKASVSRKKKKTQQSETLEILIEQNEQHLALFRQSVHNNEALSNEIISLMREQSEKDDRLMSVFEKLADKF